MAAFSQKINRNIIWKYSKRISVVTAEYSPNFIQRGGESQ